MQILLTGLLIFLGLFSLVLLFYITSSFFGLLRTWVPFVTTPNRDIKEMFEVFEFSENDILYELGSGNGKVCFMAEKKYGVKTVGFELTLWLYIYSKAKAFFTRSKAEFYFKDFFKADWSGTTVIYAYMFYPLMTRIEEKFLRECPKGSRAILRDFAFPNLMPEKTLKTHNGHKLFFYIK